MGEMAIFSAPIRENNFQNGEVYCTVESRLKSYYQSRSKVCKSHLQISGDYRGVVREVARLHIPIPTGV